MLLVAGFVVFPACSGSQAGPQPIGQLPPLTKATLAGPLCTGNSCQCRNEGDAGAPTRKGLKRYEFQVGPSEHELWVTLDDMVFYKGVETAKECYYVDLAPGHHKVSLHARQSQGIGAALRISERATAQPWWYSTFAFSCGSPGRCHPDELKAFRASLAKYKRNVHDPCGSTKIVGVAWDARRLPDDVDVGALKLDFTLDIRSFAPSNAPGAEACADNY